MALYNCSNDSESVASLFRQLEDKQHKHMIPAVVMMVVFSVVGLVGNVLVIVVYSRKVKVNPTKILIMTIAGFDLIANLGGIPSEIYIMMDGWTFTTTGVCKLKVFLGSLSTLGGAFSLCTVAVIRYRKICKPHGWEVNIKGAKIACTASLILAVVFALPYVVIYGNKSRDTPCDGIKGTECFASDYYHDTIWPLLNNILFIFLFICLSSSFVILYICIGRTAWKHRNYNRSSVNAPTGRTRADRKQSSQNSQQCSFKGAQNGQFQIENVDSKRDIMFGGRRIDCLACCYGRQGSCDDANNNHPTESLRMSSTNLNSETSKNFSHSTKSFRISSESTSLEVAKPTDRQGLELKNPQGTALQQTRSAENGCIATDSSVLQCGLPNVNTDNNSEDHSSAGLDKDKIQVSIEIELFYDKDKDQQSFKQTQKQNNVCSEDDIPKSDIQTCMGQDKDINRYKENTSDKHPILESNKTDERKESILRATLPRNPTETGNNFRQRKISKMTAMLIIISIIYVFSYFPFLILTILKNRRPLLYASLDGAGLIFYNLFYRVYFLNSAANPIVYSFCDNNFRQKCIQLLTCKYKTEKLKNQGGVSRPGRDILKIFKVK